jgi:Domain of unknown function (DUF4340)
MNLKTTIVLLVLAAAAAVLLLPAWFGLTSRAPAPPTEFVALGVLDKELSADKINRIEIKNGERQVVLERGADGEWSLPGKWPARQAEAEALAKTVAGLHSRFVPSHAAGEPPDFSRFGLDKPALTVTVRAGDKDHRLEFGEPPPAKDENNFSRPTWMRMDGGLEVVRLAPGLVAELDRPTDYYQQRRLFPSARVVRQEGSAEKVERLTAKALAVEDTRKEGTGPYALTRVGEAWEMSRPVRDRTDSEHLNALLGAVPDVWAEQFVPRPYKDLADYGLKDPEQTISVTKPSGDTVTLLIGKLSPTVHERKVPGPAPPPGVPFQPPPVTVKEEYRYAKLRDNDQIFEIKVDRLKDIFVASKELRDTRLAHFKPEDVRRLEVKYAGHDVVLVKDKDAWHLESPIKAEAEATKVTELLDKLSAADVRDADLIDSADAKAYGFDDPAKVGSIKVTVEEEKGEGAAKKKETRTLSFALGKDDTAAKKLYVRTDDWPRINAIDDSMVLLVKRPALAYRGRRALEFAIGDVEQIEVKRGAETVILKQDKGTWKLPGPAAADADLGKAGTLAGTLGGLEVTEYVKDKPEAKDLETYGLAKDALAVKLTFNEASKKPAQTLLIGKAVPDKPNEYYAKLESGTSVFAVTKAVRDALDQDSLSYRPLQLWRVPVEDVTGLRVKQAGQEEYRLTHKDAGWQISGPFEAVAQSAIVGPMTGELLAPRAERYVTAKATADKLKEYGLDEPHLRIVLAPNKPEATERTLLIGKKAPEPQRHYAKLADGDAVFEVGEKLTAALDRGALDLLDRQLLTLDRKTIERIQSKGGTAPLTLARKGDDWQVTESPVGAAFPADDQAVNLLLLGWSHLDALHFAAYGPKVDLAKYGLDKPATTVTVTVQPPAADGKKPPVQTHTLALGKAVEGSPGERYARLDDGPGVAVLPAFSAAEFTHDYLDFVDHSLLKFDAAALTGIKRQGGGDALEVVKKDEWQILKPADKKADEKIMQLLADRLASLRAVRIAAYPAKDLKAFGLDAPAAVVTLQLGGDKPGARVLKIGKPVEEKDTTGRSPDRFTQVEGSAVVAVLSGPMAELLLAPPIRFRDRAVAQFADADKIVLERGPRKATFASVDGNWKLTEPMAAAAEQTEIEELINAVARLRADEMVAEKPTDLKPYGLDKPQAQWRFLSGTKEVLNLLIGSADKTGRRCYAKLAGGDVVFLLDPPTTTRILAEYRTRGVWASPLDAAQVESVRFGYERNPFTLEKVDGLWEVAGKPGELVKALAVNDALDALARLRVERYVLDKGADPKLYGLEPPELAIDVRTRDGKRTLQIGRTEGESKRYYARLPDKDRTDVFIISEADGARIVRDLAAFTEKVPKKP